MNQLNIAEALARMSPFGTLVKVMETAIAEYKDDPSKENEDRICMTCTLFLMKKRTEDMTDGEYLTDVIKRDKDTQN